MQWNGSDEGPGYFVCYSHRAGHSSIIQQEGSERKVKSIVARLKVKSKCSSMPIYTAHFATLSVYLTFANRVNAPIFGLSKLHRSPQLKTKCTSTLVQNFKIKQRGYKTLHNLTRNPSNLILYWFVYYTNWSIETYRQWHLLLSQQNQRLRIECKTDNLQKVITPGAVKEWIYA